ncbi:MAG: hypothetical protein K2P53_02835 [Rickettsiales bacterium]|jgi:hypothetical protein|nr:hypothetical protein [Rickettsiales bacterium]
MPKNAIKMFKTKFPEITPQLDIGSIKAYVKNAFYDSAEPIYGIGAESQMHRLIVEAEKILGQSGSSNSKTI